MSFVAAAFLTGLALLAVPWWLHRRQAGHPEQHVVSSLLLLRPSELPERSRKQVQHRWLLALRMLLVAALAVAFAQPLLERGDPAVAPADALPRLIAVDTSLSMGAGFDSARARAYDIIDGLPAGGRAALVTVADELTVRAPMTRDRGALREAVGAIQPGAGRLAFDGLIGRLTALAGTLVDGAVRLELVSDFQQSALPAQFNGLIDGAGGPMALHPVAVSEENWLIDAIDPAADEVAVRVRGFATADRRLEVTLHGERGELGRREATVPAGGVETVRFALPEVGPGDTWLQASITSGDSLPGDDDRFHVLRQPREVPMPLVASPGADAQVGYLAAAIGAGAPRFRLEDPEQTGPVAVLVDPGSPAGALNRLLERHLDNGGGVLMTVGPATLRAPTLPVIEQVVRAATPASEARGVVAVDRRHPVLAGFGEWQGVMVSRHLVAEPTTGSVLLALDDGSPLLVEHRLGAGRVLVLLTGLEPAWSNLVTTPAFVTFVADALGYLAEDTLPAAAVAGEPLVLPGVGTQLFDRHGRRMLALEDTVGRTAAPLLAPGVYTLRTPSRERLLAVNPDRRESELTAADPDLLARWQAATRALAAPAPVSPAGGGGRIVPLAPWLLALLALLAMAEAVAANIVRSSRTGAPA